MKYLDENMDLDEIYRYMKFVATNIPKIQMTK